MGRAMWLQSALGALVVWIAFGSCSEDGSCPTSGSLWLQLKGSKSSHRGVGEPDFFPVNGGVDRSCRGSHNRDDSNSHYVTVAATTMDDCKKHCLSNSACKGIEYSHLSCRVWTRQQGIQASFPNAGSTCLRLLQDSSAMLNFKEVDGGQGKGCRGSHPADKEDAYFKSTTADTLDECKSICVQDAQCQGVSYQSRGLCEVWVREGGIQATADDSESICLEVPPNPTTTQSPTEPVTTGTTTAPIDDNWEPHRGLNCYKHHGADGIDGKDPLDGRRTLQECKEECLKEKDCSGIVMPQGDGGDVPKKCWLRRNVRKSRCTAGSPYNFWLRPGANIETIETNSTVIDSTTCCDGYDKWPNLDNGKTCAGCTALVLTEPYEGRCDKYCESFGHECFSAAEEVEEGCEVKYKKECNEPIEGTSDMLCSCRKKLAVDDPNCDWPGPPKPEKSCCKKFKQWPDVDNGVTCDNCMALVLAEKYGGRCDRYCESFGHVCIMAAEEKEENCDIKYEVPCDQAITGTSDILCKCGKRNGPPQCPAPPATTQTTTPTPSPNKRIQVLGKQILVDGTPLHIKGVAWNPVPKGGVHPADLDFAAAVEEDAKLMQQMGINAVRTYEPIVDKQVLDILWSKGIWVVNSVYNWGGADADSAAEPVLATKDHPAILMWSIGNEWNYNGLYVGSSFFDCVGRIRDVANVVLEHDTSHPISSIYGDVGKLDQAVDSLPEIEVWGINAYRGISFGNLFRKYEGITNKPMYFGEYGADAYNAKINSEDQDSQAKATKQLTEEILEQSSVKGRGSCIGGFIFEFNDEWHKDNDGSRNRHDTGGTAPGGGPYPDMTFNEEWWGLVTIDRETRKAFGAYQQTELPTAPQKITS